MDIPQYKSLSLFEIEPPEEARIALLEDAAKRDRATARRTLILKILWRERYLTREGLIARVEGILGKRCFGESAWEDTFYRDMQAVNGALASSGYDLGYSRKIQCPGYYLRGQPRLHPELQRILDGCIAEVDIRQIAIYRELTPAERFQQGCSISETAHQVVAYRRRQRNNSQKEPGGVGSLPGKHPHLAIRNISAYDY